MKNRSKFLLKNISFFALGEIGTKLIFFFLVPLYTYVLTTDQFGTVDLIFTISTVLTPIIMLNIGEAIMRYLLDKDSDSNKIMSVGLIMIVFGVFLSLLIVPIASKFSILSNYKWYMYFHIVLCAIKFILTGYLRGKNQLKQYAISSLLNAFLIAIFNIVFLVVLDMGIKGYLLAYILAETCVIIYTLIVGNVFESLKQFKIDSILAKEMILFSLAVVPNSLLWWIINSSDRVMVTAIRGLSENGLLAVSYKIPSLLIVLNNILMQAWKYSAIKEQDSKDNEKFTNTMFNKVVRTSVLICATLILIIKPLTKILFEASYFSSWNASIYLLLGFVFMGVSTFIGTIYYVKKDMVGNMLSALFGAVINIVLNAILIPVIGFSGATLAATLSYLCILLYRYFDTKKYQKLYLIKKDYLFLLILTIIMIIGNLLNNIIGNIMLIISFCLIILINYRFIFDTLKSIQKNFKVLVRQK